MLRWWKVTELVLRQTRLLREQKNPGAGKVALKSFLRVFKVAYICQTNGLSYGHICLNASSSAI